MFDLIIRNGRIVTATEVLPVGLEIGVKDGKISCIGYQLAAEEGHTQVVDAEGGYITPGGVDSHVHIEQDNAPTGDTWETGTRSAIAGGNTTVIAFASQKRSENSVWPALTEYHRRATSNAFCDYGFHVILTNPTAEVMEKELPDLVEKEGISSVKLYMTYEPLKLGDGDLFNVMMRTRSLGMTTMIHAENNDIIEQITKRLGQLGNTSTYFHSIARPQIAESEATYRVISLAEVTDTPILIVHMSAPTAVKHVTDAQLKLLPIHAETCPQYLFLQSDRLRSGPEDLEGGKYVCAPPLRHDARDLEDIWMGLANGTFTVVSSDHAPSTFNHPNGKMKGLTITKDTDSSSDDHGDGHHCHHHADFRAVPNGLPGIETRLPLLFDRTFDPTTTESLPSLTAERAKGDSGNIRISLPRFVELTSTNPAKMYGLGERKGSLQPGFDADIVIWYPEAMQKASESTNPSSFTITNSDLHHRIDYTPFEGISVRNWPRYVFLRGQMAWDRDNGGVLIKKGDGQFLKRGKGRVLRGQVGRTSGTGMAEGGDWKYWA